MITKAELEKRNEELRLEMTVQIARVEATYSGAIQENERLLSSFDSKAKNKPGKEEA